MKPGLEADRVAHPRLPGSAGHRSLTSKSAL